MTTLDTKSLLFFAGSFCRGVIYDFFKYRPVLFAAATSAVLFFVMLPILLLPFELIAGSPTTRLTLASVALFQLAWALTLCDRGLRWWVPFLYPLQFVHLLYMVWRVSGKVNASQGVTWKGRVLR